MIVGAVIGFLLICYDFLDKVSCFFLYTIFLTILNSANACFSVKLLLLVVAVCINNKCGWLNMSSMTGGYCGLFFLWWFSVGLNLFSGEYNL